jgi:hypothetical protein
LQELLNDGDVSAGKLWISQKARAEFEAERTKDVRLRQKLYNPHGTEETVYRRLLDDMRAACDRFEQMQQSAADADTAGCATDVNVNATE